MRPTFYARSGKRMLDAVLATVSLGLTAPLLVLVAGLVWLDVGSPVLFRQTRPGRHGRLFRLTKFRTMREPGSTASSADADRVTTLGRWLRSLSLDELPELLHVVRGDMSLVGPRPLLPEYLPLYTPTQRRRHAVRPGITGLAQVNGRNELPWERRFELDVDYVDRVSLALDLRILALTAWRVATRSGINAPGGATTSKFTGARS